MKILVKIDKDKLKFINKKKLTIESKNMLNTNVISHDELVFSDEYINENPKIIVTFFNDLIKNYNLTTLSFQNNDVAELIFPFINKIKNISIIIFESDEVLPYNFCEKLVKCNDIKFVSANYIPEYMFEMMDKYGIVSKSRDEVLFTSPFMQKNDLKNYSSIFYKGNITLDLPLNEDDLKDLDMFFDINRHLKTINISDVDFDSIEKIIKLLKTNNHKNIKILIHNNIQDPKKIEYLKKINKNKYNINFKIKYSDKYIQDNIIKQTNNNILRICALLILAIVVMSFGYVFYDNYHSMYKVSEINKQLEQHITATDPEEIIKDIESNGTVVKNNFIASLKMINNDVIGWLKVNNTNIDYAVVQAKDNEYYLSNNIYKEKDSNGWLFLDYENNSTSLDDNNIIYGHNRYINGVMFGTLNKTIYKNWYTNEENQIISFDTLYGSYKFKIFSIYIIPTTSDYIKTNFKTPKEKLNFLDKITKRSIYNFNVKTDINTKVLTLSTCNDEASRLVLHAALIEE